MTLSILPLGVCTPTWTSLSTKKSGNLSAAGLAPEGEEYLNRSWRIKKICIFALY